MDVVLFMVFQYQLNQFTIISGKTSTGKCLAENIGAQHWKTPPDSISHLRSLFDKDVVLRTAYYSLGNYIAALEVQNIMKTMPVIMDR